MTPYYSDRQIGWFVIVLALVVLGTTLVVDLMHPGETTPVWYLPVMVLIFLGMGSMSVVVDRQSLRIRMTYGLPRRTIPVERIKSCEVYKGGRFGFARAHIKPSHGTFEMNGHGGVVLILDQGRPLTVSARDPQKLAKAIHKAMDRQRGT